MILGEVKLWCIKDNLRKGAKAFGAETVRDLLDTIEHCETLIHNLERNMALLEKRLAGFGVSKHHVNVMYEKAQREAERRKATGAA